MNSFRNAVWIQIKESSSKTFRPVVRRGTSLVAAFSFVLGVMFAPAVYAQNSAPTEAREKKDMKIKVVTNKDGKTEVMELNGEEMLNKPEIAKMLKDLKIDMSKLKNDLKGNTNISVNRVIRTDGSPSTTDEEVTITCSGKGDKNKCVVIVNGDSAKCKAMGKCSTKGTCSVQTTTTANGKQCKVITVTKSIGDKGDRIETTAIANADGSNEEIVTENIRGQELQANANTNGDNAEIITEDIHGNELPTRVFIRKFNDDDDDNVVIIDGNLNLNETNGDITINSNANENENGNHNRTMKFIIKQTNENGDPSKVKVRIHKYINDEVKVSEPKETTEPKEHKLQDMTSTLDVPSLNLAPNPNKGQFTLSFTLKETGNATITIADLAGHEVYTEPLFNFTGDYSKSIDLTSKARGEYLLKISQNGKSATATIVLE